MSSVTPEIELSTGKRGSKTCQCGKRVAGARTKICPFCQNFFPVKATNVNSEVVSMGSYPVASQLPAEYAEGNFHTIIVTPDRVCPVEVPTQFKYGDVLGWVENVRAKGSENGEFFSRAALMAFARMSLKGADFKRFKDIVLNEVQDATPLIPSEEVE